MSAKNGKYDGSSSRGSVVGKDIQPVVFTIEPDSELWSADVSLLHMPDSWLAPLQYLQGEKNGRQGLPNSIEVRSLNSVIRALFPQVYTWLSYVPVSPDMFRAAGPGGARRPWLLASGPIDRDALWRLVRAWLHVTYGDCSSFRTVYDGLTADDLRWETVRMNVAQRPAENKTATLHPDAYKVLPTLIAHRLAGIPASMRQIDGVVAGDRVVDEAGASGDDCGLMIDVHKQRHYLMRVPSNEGAELVSWPPSYLSVGSNHIPYSYVVRLTAQTLIGDPTPRIHAHYGVRRWVHALYSKEGQFIMKNRNYSVFMRATHPWSRQGDGNAFTVARMRPVEDAVGKRVPVWNDSVPEILALAQAGFAEALSLPSPDALVRRPVDWLRSAGVDGVQAAITYAVTPLYHEVKQGLSLDVHERLTCAIQKKMNGRLSLCPPVARMDTIRNAKGSGNPLAMRLREIDEKKGEPGFRLRALGESVGRDITVEIYWQHSRVRDHLAAQVERLLTWPERDIDQSTAPADEDTSADDDDAASTGPLPPTAELGVMLPGLDWSELSNAAFVTVSDELDYDPELVHYARELGGAGQDTSVNGETGVPAEGQPSTGKRKPKPRRAKDDPPGPSPESREFPLPGGGVLRVVTISTVQSKIGSPLDNTGKYRRDKRLATNARAAEIRAYLQEHRPTEDGAVVLALVEIPDYTKRIMRDMRHRDPKMAIKIGMMGAGRVTQFIAPYNDTLKPEDANSDVEQRAEMAVRDGLRQLGYLPSGIGFKPQDPAYALSDDLVVAAVWMLRLTHKTAQQPVYMPVVVMTRTSDPRVWAWLPDGKSPSVRPYRQALLDMYDIKPESVSRKMAGQNLEALRRFVQDELLSLGDDVLILAAAQNARALWPAMANGVVRLDHLQFGKQDQPQPVAGMKGRPRIIRLRTSERGETPEYYWPGVKPGNSRQGIWCVSEEHRLFFNIGPKPKGMAGSMRSKDDDPREYYAIPSILEVVPVALQPGDKPEAWVNAVDQWRKMGYLTTDATLLPLPMMLAWKMDEYAQAIGPRVLSEEWDRVGADDDDEDDEQAGSGLQMSLFSL